MGVHWKSPLDRIFLPQSLLVELVFWMCGVHLSVNDIVLFCLSHIENQGGKYTIIASNIHLSLAIGSGVVPDFLSPNGGIQTESELIW